MCSPKNNRATNAVATSSRFNSSDTVRAGVRSRANTSNTGARPPPTQPPTTVAIAPQPPVALRQPTATHRSRPHSKRLDPSNDRSHYLVTGRIPPSTQQAVKVAANSRLERATLGWNVGGGWWWADPLVGLVIVHYAVREARHIFAAPMDD